MYVYGTLVTKMAVYESGLALSRAKRGIVKIHVYIVVFDNSLVPIPHGNVQFSTFHSHSALVR